MSPDGLAAVEQRVTELAACDVLVHNAAFTGTAGIPGYAVPFDEQTDEAFAMARRAAREEGLWSGPSTGANIEAALRIARRLGEGRRVATVLVDSGLKYLGGDLYR